MSVEGRPPWAETAYFLAVFLQAGVDVEPAAAAYRAAFAADPDRLARLANEVRSLVDPSRSDAELDTFLAASAPRWTGYSGRQVLLRSANVLFNPPSTERTDTTHSATQPAHKAHQTERAERAADGAEPVQQVAPVIDEAVPAEPELDPRVAPHPRRLAAAGMDVSVVVGVFVVLALVGQLAGLERTWAVLVTVAVALAAAFACVQGLSVWLTGGQTVGKALFGLTERRINDALGAPPNVTLSGLAWAIGRHSVGYIVIDVFGIGALASFVSRRRRCLHDLAFGSEVVSYEPGSRTGQESLDARLRSFQTRLKAGLERSQQRFGWAFALFAWLAKIILVVATVVFALAKWAVGPAAAASRPIGTARAADLPAPAHLSTKAVALLSTGTTIATLGIAAVALARPPDYTNINIVFPHQTVGQPETSEIHIMRADGSQLRQITSNDSHDGYPDLFHDRRIVFTSERDGDREIYVMNADGTDPVRLTEVPGADSCPAWSPDGDRIAFSSERDGDREIYVMNADGTDPVRLTEVPGADSCPGWSPDGDRIVFASGRADDGEIYVIDVDGTDAVRLTEVPGADWSPAWSPDGDRIVFASERDGDREIYVMNADGTDPVRLTEVPGADTSPTWSPDGEKILFWSERGFTGGGNELYLMNPDGTDQTRLTHFND